MHISATQDKSRHDMTRQVNTMRGNIIRDKTKTAWYKARQDNMRQDKTI